MRISYAHWGYNKWINKNVPSTMLFKNEVEDKSMFDMPLPTGKASPNNISMQLRTTRDKRDPGPEDDPY